MLRASDISAFASLSASISGRVTLPKKISGQVVASSGIRYMGVSVMSAPAPGRGSRSLRGETAARPQLPVRIMPV